MAERDERPNPYLGPRPFERTDAALFFGRESETRELLSLVIASQVVLVYAASGAGKTSLLNAGLVPLLERDEHFEVLPAARLVGGLDEQTLSAAANVHARSLLGGWASDPSALTRDGRELSLGEFLAERPHPSGADGLPAPRAILFDQFEELFTLYPSYWSHQRGFLEQIAEALEQDALLRVVLAIREDYVAQLDPFTDVFPGGLGVRLRLEGLGRDQALDAVRRPATRFGRSYAPGVAERLVSDLMTLRVDTGRGTAVTVEGPLVEPVQLQVTCHRLWAELPVDAREITDAHVRTYGDVDQALAWFYDTAILEAAEVGRVNEGRLRRWITDAFVTTMGTRSTVYRSAEKTAAIPNASIDALENRHLIRAEWRAGARWYELTHDRLIEPIRKSNARFRAFARRRRRRRGIIASVSAVALIIAGLAVSGAPEGDVQRKVGVVVRRSELNVQYAVYLRSTGISVEEEPSTADRRRRGNLLSIDVATQGYGGAELVLKATTLRASDLEPVRVLPGAAADSAGITPGSDLDATATLLWIPLPPRSGRYLYEVRVDGSAGTLDITRSKKFAVTSDGAASDASGKPAPRTRLTVGVSGPGIVSISPPGLRCPPECAAEFSYGTAVVLTPVARAGSVFRDWRGPCRGPSACTLPMTTNVFVHALFVATP
jgi:hypothetical protein